MRKVFLSTIGVCLCLPFFAWAEGGYEIAKVNHEFIDKDGQTHAEIAQFVAKARYQSELAAAGKGEGIRFIVHWKAPSTLMTNLVVRIEARGFDADTQREVTETLVKTYERVPGFSGWATLDLRDETWRHFGKLMAWKATLLHDNQPMATRKSFTWDDTLPTSQQPTATPSKP